MASKDRIPRLLRSPFVERDFHNKLVRRVYLAHDRRFLESAFSRDDDGGYRLREDLSPAERKRAFTLARQISRNRGSLKTGRVAALLAIVAALLLFNLLFKNALLTRAGERALETAFEARAVIRDLDLRLLRGQLTFSNLSVADRDRPFRNLFEIGPTTIDIDTTELLKGNFVAHTLTIGNVRWNSERSDSGQLPGTLRRSPPPRSEPPGLTAVSIPALRPEDAYAFLMQHYDRLTTPAILVDAELRLDETAQEVPGRIEAGRARLDELSTSVDRVSQFRPAELGDLETALAAYRAAEQLVAEIRTTSTAVQRDLEQLQDDIAAVAVIPGTLSAALTADVAYLTERITDVTDDPSGFLIDILARLVEEQFADRLGYVSRAQQVAARLRGAEPGESRAPFRPGGVDVIYPSVRWPRFYLGDAVISFGTAETDTFQRGALHHLSSAPRLVGRPTRFSLTTRRDRRNHHLDAELALHSSVEPLLQLDYRGDNVPLRFSTDLGAVNLHEISGTTRFATTAHLDRDWMLRGTTDLTLADPRLSLATGVPAIDAIIADAVAGAAEIEAQFEFTARDDRITSLSGSTSLDRPIASAIRVYFDEQRAAFEARVRHELTDLVASRRAELQPLEDQLAQLGAAVETEIARASGYRRSAEDTLTEINDRVAALRDQAQQRLREEAQRQIESTIERAPLPRIDADRIPRLR